MAFSAAERKVLLSIKGVGPTVVARLEQMGIGTLRDLAGRDAIDVCAEAAGLTGSSCWKNSPQARAAIRAVIDTAKAATNARS